MIFPVHVARDFLLKVYQKLPHIKYRVQSIILSVKHTASQIKLKTKFEWRKIFMSQKNNRIVVPEARDAMDKFKMEAANEVGVTLNDGYNGNLTSKQAGSVGGQMVNNMNPVRTMRFERHNRISQGHKITVKYAFSLTV